MTARKFKFHSPIVCVAILIVTPALASKAHKKKVSAPNAQFSQSQRAYGANAVYGWDGRYRGTDPDPNIRFQLMRDQNYPKD